MVSSVEDGLDKMARDARTVLLAIAGLNLGGAALLWLAGGIPEFSVIAPQLATGVAFAVLAFWARRSPMIPVTVGVVLYGVSLAAGLLLNPLALLSMWGLILNGILVVLCINGLKSARNYNALKRRFADPSPR